MALGSGLKIHCLKKCNATSNNFGLQSSKRFGNSRYNETEKEKALPCIYNW